MKSVISWSRDSSSNLDSSSKMLQGRKTLERFFICKNKLETSLPIDSELPGISANRETSSAKLRRQFRNQKIESIFI